MGTRYAVALYSLFSLTYYSSPAIGFYIYLSDFVADEPDMCVYKYERLSVSNMRQSAIEEIGLKYVMATFNDFIWYKFRRSNLFELI